MNGKTARDTAIAKGHQPGMFKREMVNGHYQNRTRCQHRLGNQQCKCYLYDGANGVWGSMLMTHCRFDPAMQAEGVRG